MVYQFEPTMPYALRIIDDDVFQGLEQIKTGEECSFYVVTENREGLVQIGELILLDDYLIRVRGNYLKLNDSMLMVSNFITGLDRDLYLEDIILGEDFRKRYRVDVKLHIITIMMGLLLIPFTLGILVDLFRKQSKKRKREYLRRESMFGGPDSVIIQDLRAGKQIIRNSNAPSEASSSFGSTGN